MLRPVTDKPWTNTNVNNFTTHREGSVGVDNLEMMPSVVTSMPEEMHQRDAVETRPIHGWSLVNLMHRPTKETR